MLLEGYNKQVLIIERSSFEETGTPADDDLRLNVSVVVGGYSAADQVWVLATDWREFLNVLRTLEKIRQGQATLVGASPNELKISFNAIDRAGHMAVSGFIGWNSPDGFYQKCEFGFAFDSGKLRSVIREFALLGR
jgi:hypothetical protein